MKEEERKMNFFLISLLENLEDKQKNTYLCSEKQN